MSDPCKAPTRDGPPAAAEVPPTLRDNALNRPTVQLGGRPGGSGPVAAAAEAAIPLPERFGRYQVVRRLGEGGMGLVFEGKDPTLDRSVAIKVLTASAMSDPVAIERFLREARAAAALEHPHVVRIYDVGAEGPVHYLALELIRGETVHALIARRGKLPPEEAVGLAIQAALGLGAAAERGIVHRDVKPANLLLTAGGVLKVGDFGLARRTAHEDATLTRTGDVVGTPYYLSPEQAQAHPTDFRTDIYSLGATLYHMLAGKPPFMASSVLSIIADHIHRPLPPLEKEVPAVPRRLAQVVERMMAKDPAARHASYAELIADLERALATPTGASGVRLASATASAAAPAPSDRTGVAILAAAGVLALGAILWAVAATHRPPPPGPTPETGGPGAPTAGGAPSRPPGPAAPTPPAGDPAAVAPLPAAGALPERADAEPMPGFHVPVVTLPDGRIELKYDFSTAEQLLDWPLLLQAREGGGGRWRIVDGAIATVEERGPPVRHRAEWTGDFEYEMSFSPSAGGASGHFLFDVDDTGAGYFGWSSMAHSRGFARYLPAAGGGGPAPVAVIKQLDQNILAHDDPFHILLRRVGTWVELRVDRQYEISLEGIDRERGYLGLQVFFGMASWDDIRIRGRLAPARAEGR